MKFNYESSAHLKTMAENDSSYGLEGSKTKRLNPKAMKKLRSKPGEKSRFEAKDKN